MSGSVRLYEVSLRDGLQNEPVVVPLEQKLAILNGLVAAGFTDIEVTSFVRPRWVPQLADASALMSQLPNTDDVRFWALVPNQRGLERGLEVGVQNIATFLSASETHNLKNVNRTIKESVAGLQSVLQTATAEGLGIRGYISCVFGCPYEGDVDVEKTIELAHAILDGGADEVALGDTTGMGHPEQVKQVLTRVVESGISLDKIALHFHDTRGTALANVYAAWQLGARSFDGSISGVGGCPYAAGAAGNACTQDLIHLFDRMEISSGIDLETACLVGADLEGALGRPLPGRYHQYWQGSRDRKAVKSA